MTFTESSTVEQMILDTVTRKRSLARLTVRENPPGWDGSLGGDLRPARWEYVPAAGVPRQVAMACPRREDRLPDQPERPR
ncbi:hypothetical protein [Methanoculleus sp. 10]|uniref:hypothetical protein n=1 Tax=Methanoculleus sp. 10 TaxID=430615 RepID=UPI0025D96B93|nr:hypothetical protein [Methanoculleus sp. 10]